jgi:hypothetical protein
MTNSANPKVTCHVCGKDAVLIGNGTIRVHGPKDDRCSGSGADPGKLAVIGYRVWMKVPGAKDSWTHAASFDTKTQAYDWGSACLFDTNVDELMGEPTEATAPEALDAANAEAQDVPPWLPEGFEPITAENPSTEQESTVDDIDTYEVPAGEQHPPTIALYPPFGTYGPTDEEAGRPDAPSPPEPDHTVLVLGQVVTVQLAGGLMKGILEQADDGTLKVRVLNPTEIPDTMPESWTSGVR